MGSDKDVSKAKNSNSKDSSSNQTSSLVESEFEVSGLSGQYQNASSVKRKLSRKKSSTNGFASQVALIGLTLPSVEHDRRVPFLIYPEDKFKELFWDVLLSLILLATCILTPFTLAFGEETS